MADLNEKLEEINNTKDITTEMDPADVEANRAMGILAYLSWLVLIPIFAAKDSKFARFHVNQGLVLAIAETVIIALCRILKNLFLIGWVFGVIEALVGLVAFILVILGIVNAANGRAKELPFIGSFKLFK